MLSCISAARATRALVGERFDAARTIDVYAESYLQIVSECES